MAASVSYDWKAFLILVYTIIIAIVFSSCNSAASSPPSALQGNLDIEGSTALEPLVRDAAAQFQKLYPQVHIHIGEGGSLAGLDAVTNGKADIGESDVYADPALYPDPDLTDHIICVVPFVMIVNKDVGSLSSLKQSDIVKIFVNGNVRNWQDLGGKNIPIVPIVRSDTSGTRASFLKYVLDNVNEQSGLSQTSSSNDMLTKVANTPGAIGYVALPALMLSPQRVNIQEVAIDGLFPTGTNILSGKYTFWGYEHMYTMSSNQKPALAYFLQFMLSKEVQQQAESKHYIPLSSIKF